MRTTVIGETVHFYKELSSTQTLAVNLAERKLRENGHGTVIIAERQRRGKGRIDERKWISPKGGIWLSIILKPKIRVTQTTLLPIIAALAVGDAIKEKTRLNSRLKWPNDIMIQDKKVSGIVVDTSIDAKTINYAVIGVGINANIDAAKLSSYVSRSRGGINSKCFGITSLKNELSGKNVNIIVIMQSFLEKLEYYYFQLEKEGSKKIITKLKERSETVGNSVLVKQDKETFEGVAIDVDTDGILLVKTPEGNINEVASGEIIVIRNRV